jgi:NAD(P)-dependent dehydrogenase (short-subunit alcohol dehydrogenase family)
VVAGPGVLSGVVAITGAGGALGGAVARKLVASGYKALLLDISRGKERLAGLAAELGSNVHAYTGDFETDDAWRGAIAESAAELGGPPTHGVLIAGGWAGGSPVHEGKGGDAWASMMRANADTAHRALSQLLPAMIEKKAGSIVVIGSRAVERPWTSAGSAAYAASKAAVVALAQVVAQETLSHGVRVNAVLPSTLDTPANRAGMPDADPGAWVSLESAAGVIAFLLSDDARDITGAAIPLYGRV